MNKIREEILIDIYRAVKQSGVSADWSDEQIFDWYGRMYDAGTLWFRYDEQGQLMGFIDGVKIHTTPTDMADFYRLYCENPYGIGTVGVYINCVVLAGRDTLAELILSTEKFYPDVESVCWYREKQNRFISFKKGEASKYLTRFQQRVDRRNYA